VAADADLVATAVPLVAEIAVAVVEAVIAASSVVDDNELWAASSGVGKSPSTRSASS
jgi:hypothetical protein